MLIEKKNSNIKKNITDELKKYPYLKKAQLNQKSILNFLIFSL